MVGAARDGSCSWREQVMEGRRSIGRRRRRVHCDGVWKLGAGGREVRGR